MNDIQIRNYRDSEIRLVKIDYEIWWVLADVCKILGYKNPTMILDRLDFDEKAKSDLGLPGGDTNIINESGLYSVILRSDKPQAKQFKRWVTHEVLPSIRETGSYRTLQASVSDLDSLSRRIDVLEKEALLRRVDALEAAYKDADDFDSKSCRTVEQVPAHIIAALNCMIGSGFTVGYMLDFLEDNHIWLSNRVLTEYIRKRKADKCGY
ncbi:MAG: Bro-N domain-containing protein [Oscillospiraceae bacterium]|jgi:prophage antirepressor-like protein